MVIIYLSLIVFVAFLLRNQHKYLQVIPFILLTIFAAIRYGFGNDYFSYYMDFQAVKWQGEGSLDEVLYRLLSRLCPNFYVLVALTSVIFVLGVYLFVVKSVDSRYIWLSLLVFVVNPYLFLVNLSAIRQSMSMILFLIAIPYANKRKPLIYAGLMIIAFFFHKSALLLLPMYLITDKKVTAKWICAVCSALLVFLMLPNFSALLRPVVSLFNDANYWYYFNSSGGNSLRATLLTLVYFIYVIGNLHRLQGRDLVYGKLYLIGTVCGILAYRLSLFTRIQMYFDIFSIVVIPTILRIHVESVPAIVDSRYIGRSVWNCVNRYVLPVLVFVIYALRIYSFFTNSMWASFTEYRTIFELI